MSTQLSLITDELETIREDMERVHQNTVIDLWHIGKRLNVLKEKTPHGQWGEAFKAAFGKSQNYAQRYMKLNKEMPELSNAANSQHLPSFGALTELLSAPEEIKEEFKEKLDEGETFTASDIKKAKDEAKREVESAAQQKLNEWIDATQREREVRIEAQDELRAHKAETKKKLDSLKQKMEAEAEAEVRERLAKEIAGQEQAIKNYEQKIKTLDGLTTKMRARVNSLEEIADEMEAHKIITHKLLDDLTLVEIEINDHLEGANVPEESMKHWFIVERRLKGVYETLKERITESSDNLITSEMVEAIASDTAKSVN